MLEPLEWAKWNRTYSWHGSCWLSGEVVSAPATVPLLYAARYISALMVRQNDIYSACSDPSGVSSRLPPLRLRLDCQGNLRPTYFRATGLLLQAHQKATKAKVIPGHLSEGRSNLMERISTRRWREAIFWVFQQRKNKWTVLWGQGTQHLACSQTLILEAHLEMLREARKCRQGGSRDIIQDTLTPLRSDFKVGHYSMSGDFMISAIDSAHHKLLISEQTARYCWLKIRPFLPV